MTDRNPVRSGMIGTSWIAGAAFIGTVLLGFIVVYGGAYALGWSPSW